MKILMVAALGAISVSAADPQLAAAIKAGQRAAAIDMIAKKSADVNAAEADGCGPERYRVGEQMHYMSVLWGFAEVTPTKVTILAEIAEKAEDIDVPRAQAAVEEAERLLEMGGLPSEVEAARVSLEKARLRKRIAERALTRH